MRTLKFKIQPTVTLFTSTFTKNVRDLEMNSDLFPWYITFHCHDVHMYNEAICWLQVQHLVYIYQPTDSPVKHRVQVGNDERIADITGSYKKKKTTCFHCFIDKYCYTILSAK